MLEKDVGDMGHARLARDVVRTPQKQASEIRVKAQTEQDPTYFSGHTTWLWAKYFVMLFGATSLQDISFGAC